MPLASEDEIDGFGLDDFSADFLEELDRAEEAFPSSFCPVPPSSAVTDDDEYDSMFLEPCSQEITDALDEMERQIKLFASTAPNPPVRGRPKNISECTLVASSTSSTLVTSTPVSIKVEPSSPTSDLFSSTAPSPIKKTKSRKRTRSDSDEEIDCKKPKLSPPTHLSQFFSSYTKYEYDPSGPASQQFQQLRCVYKWSARGRDADDAHAGYSRAVGLTFSQAYGDDAIEDAHVNLMDFVDILTTGEPVHRFATERELSEYTKSTGKIFPQSQAHGSLLRHLLRRIWHPPPDNVRRQGGTWVKRRS
ncbi:hypothetical protein B0H14DRAFT_3152107 [Mycena olivaceomarginata]|nr:hypothetical protein B0H14DRAFT_3152107 [Mycena olivaceomarginata]